MSITGLTGRSAQAVSQAPIGAEDRYLTDGIRLFRRTAALEQCPAGFAWLEDCRSLSVVLATAHEMAQLVPVHAAREDPEPK